MCIYIQYALKVFIILFKIKSNKKFVILMKYVIFQTNTKWSTTAGNTWINRIHSNVIFDTKLSLFSSHELIAPHTHTHTHTLYGTLSLIYMLGSLTLNADVLSPGVYK